MIEKKRYRVILPEIDAELQIDPWQNSRAEATIAVFSTTGLVLFQGTGMNRCTDAP